jgi:zinc protease
MARAPTHGLGYPRRALKQPSSDPASHTGSDSASNRPSRPSTNSPGSAAPDASFPLLVNATQKKVFDNGLTLILRESHRAPVVELQFWANVGSADERPGEEGLAHFHEHMLFKGTERRGVGAVAGDIEGLGGHINAYTSFDSTVYHATLPSNAWREGLDVLTDAVRHSVFDEDEIAREREVVLEEIRRSDDTPGHVLGDLAFNACYPDHPYGLPILGPADNVAGFDRARVRRFFARWYTPDNLIVVAVGDFDSEEVSTEIERLFADVVSTRESGVGLRARPEARTPEELRVALLRRPFEGHRMDLSWPAARFCDRDANYLDLLAYVLGECESSRLVRRVREEEGLVDRIDAGAYTPLDRGLFSVGFETNGERILVATKRVVEEVERLRREAVSEAELERARINFLASEQFDRESVSGLASKLGSFEVIGGGWDREALMIETIRGATPADLLRVAKTYLSSDALTVAALVPESSDPALDEDALRRAVEDGIAAAAAPRPPSIEGKRCDPSGPATSTSESSGRAMPLFAASRPARHGSGERFDASLPNGLSIHVLKRSEVPVAAVRFACLGGLLTEDRSTSGLTRFLNAMWTRGTERRGAAEFAEDVESLAAEIDGFSGRNSVGLSLDCLSETLEPALDLFAEALLTPRFDTEEIESERRETLAALERRNDRLGSRAFQLFAETEFEHHPYRLTVAGEPDSVESFTAANLRSHAARLLWANRASIAVVGDVDPERVGQILADRFGSLGRADSDFEMPPADPRPVGVRESELRMDRAQAHLVMGFRGLTLDDPDRHALELISQILAGQGGRLFLELRDRQSLAYTVSASNVEGLAEGYYSIYIATAPDKIDRARAGILEEIDRLQTERPEPAELERAIRYGTGSFAIDAQRSHARAAHLALDSIYGLGPDHADLYPEQLAQVTADDVLRVAQRVFRLDALTTSSVRP